MVKPSTHVIRKSRDDENDVDDDDDDDDADDDGDDDADGDGDDDDGGCLPSSVSLAGTASSTHVL